MDELIAINKVSVNMNISSRTLRYWEEAGLFKSTRDVQSGWRLYDPFALQCINVTNLLRRLDISISDIKSVLEIKTAENICRVLNNQLNKLNTVASDVDTRRETLAALIRIIKPADDFTLSSLENILLPAEIEKSKFDIAKIKEGINMESFETINSEIKIIKLPPMRTAAYSCADIEPEDKAYAPVKKWIEENNLSGTMRLFGFNVNPYPTKENPSYYGFGFCASVPEDVVIPEPLYEWRLPGGTYAVISQYKGDPSNGWKKAKELMSSGSWEWEYDKDRHPGLEEHIERGDKKGFIITILIPVKRK